ncbi:YbfB/YjiJ family MFS transporter [Candidimonas humi]|uniref:YbfB/YjiJ family MFS transporter n=1 Tax=Candidimonas humi TaxID=683355 RepID=A0ABV8P188_9BURK|nr:YbfB/YjiJ family MFS transporter [Candidimonas humi]MBV6306075.1 YbfB/YjiJ family MFS transporter [Candidimonas humi]
MDTDADSRTDPAGAHYAPAAISPAVAALVASLGLASAMGIGRFAFTPLLPLMQHSFDLSLRQGAWLASANYIGYFLGALGSYVFDPEPGRSARYSLLAIAVLTIATGLTHSFPAWALLRLLTGVASAYALVGISSWVLAVLARSASRALYGWVFAGVGAGMLLAGLVGLAAGVWRQSPDRAWLALGACALAVCVYAWGHLGTSVQARAPARADRGGALGLHGWILVACYGVFGFGYIIPATFLPAFARQLIDDPAVFGWVWPLFGLVSALFAVVCARLFGHLRPRVVWACGHVVIAAGVLAPAVAPGLAAVVFSTVCVGGTFMIVVMVATREAHQVAGANSARLIAAMTTVFAIGQLLGPLAIPAGPLSTAVFYPSVGAACLMLATAVALLRRDRPSADKESHEYSLRSR